MNIGSHLPNLMALFNWALMPYRMVGHVLIFISGGHDFLLIKFGAFDQVLQRQQFWIAQFYARISNLVI